jgi:PAS domain S-box-containing protein
MVRLTLKKESSDVRPALGLLCLVFLIALILPLVALAQGQSQPPPEAQANPALEQKTAVAGTAPGLSKKNVLLLHAYTYETASSLIMDPIFVKGFGDVGLGAFNLHFEFMDLAKHPDPAHRREFAKYLGRKFEKLPIDLIIALHTPAHSFLVEEGKSLFPGVPVIDVIAAAEFLHNEDLRTAYEGQMRPFRRSFVILPYATNVEFTMECIIGLRPKIRTLAVISGNGLLDRMMEQAARRGLQAWQGRLAIDYFKGLPLDEVLKRVATLAPEAAILFTNFSADPDGRTYSPPEAVRRISRAANAPVFGLFDTLLGNGGIVGGVMLTHRGEAIRTVGLALEILRGTPPTEPVTILPAHFIPMFDWEQLKRWGMDESRLPPGSDVLNRPRTIWSEYKGFVIGGIAVFLAQTLLVIGLLVQRRLKKKAESSVRQKTEELDQFFDVSLDLLCIANTDGYFLRLNPAWEKILGYTREELMAKRFLDFVHPDDLLRTQEAVSAQASQRRMIHFENRYRCKDGTYRWLEWSSAPAGNLIYAAARDVTERKRADEALRESEARLRDITFSLADWVWEVDENGVYTYSSQKGFDLLGRSREDVIGKTPFDFMPPDEAKRVAAIFSEIAANKAPIKDLENWNIRKNGESICLLTNGVPMLDEEGNLKGYRGVDKDITERKRAEAEVARARAELLRFDRSLRLSELTASLAHELNQPLTAILSNAQAALRFLKSDKPDLNEFQEIMRDIISDDQRAGNVIRSLRSMMKREEREKRPTILNDILSDVIQIFRSEAIFRNVGIETELEGFLPPVFGDKGQLQQVVLNIIMNGAEAMSGTPPERRKLILRTQRKGHSLSVSARDFGPGIDKGNLERMFEPFFTTKRSGLGMGLAICSSIIKDHGGRIWAENNPDGGATFFIELPISESGK